MVLRAGIHVKRPIGGKTMDIIVKIAHENEFLKLNEDDVKRYVECKDIFFVSRELTSDELVKISDLYYYHDVKSALSEYNITVDNTNHYEEKRDSLIIYHNGCYWENYNLQDYDGELYYHHYDGSNWEYIELEDDWDEIPDNSPNWDTYTSEDGIYHSRVYFANDKFYLIEWDNYIDTLVTATVFENSNDGLNHLTSKLGYDVAEVVPIEKCLCLEKCLEGIVSLLEDKINSHLEDIDKIYKLHENGREFSQDGNQFIIEPNTDYLEDQACLDMYEALNKPDNILQVILSLMADYSYGYSQFDDVPKNLKENFNIYNELFDNARKLLQWD